MNLLMNEDMSTHCRSCNAPILWATTEKGKAMPLDIEPVENGDIRLEERSVAAYGGGTIVREQIVLTAVYAANADSEQERSLGDVPRYVSHFATCEFADHHRKKG